MPCRDDYGPCDYTDSQQLDKVTEMLCALCTAIEQYHPDGPIQQDAGAIPGLREWWNEHKRRDEAEKAKIERKRKAEEFKQNALNKLTQEERDALGL